eukprot:scaffold27367_cov112-Isochrysis_galbana.AAC.15
MSKCRANGSCRRQNVPVSSVWIWRCTGGGTRVRRGRARSSSGLAQATVVRRRVFMFGVRICTCTSSRTTSYESYVVRDLASACALVSGLLSLHVFSSLYAFRVSWRRPFAAARGGGGGVGPRSRTRRGLILTYTYIYKRNQRERTKQRQAPAAGRAADTPPWVERQNEMEDGEEEEEEEEFG